MKEFYRRQKELRALQQTKWKLAYLQRQSQLGRALVHIKPELVNNLIRLQIYHNTIYY